MEPKKKILVTGAAGALAKKVIDKLKKDYKIVAVDFRTKVDLGIPVESYKVDLNDNHGTKEKNISDRCCRCSG
jgi:UDP-glucose 4-epimerase